MNSFALPKLSATMEEGIIVRWLKAPGEVVKAGEPLVEVETDKAVMDVESPISGRLTSTLVEEGASVAVGEAIAEFEVAPSKTPVENRTVEGGRTWENTPTGGSSIARHPVSPAARRRAKELGVDIADVTGTGPGSRIRIDDVEKAARERSDGAEADVLAYERMRQGVIETVTRSHREIPVFWVERWVDLERVFELKSELDAGQPETKTTLTDFLIQAVADTLPSHPRLLTRLAAIAPLRETVETDLSVGLVVRVPGGVVVPTLGGLGGLDLAGVSRLRARAVKAARSGRLSGSMLAPTTVSLSNVGKTGVDVLRPMILPGQTAILGVGRARERVVPMEKAIAIRMGCSIVLAADHRVVDGVEAAAFLGALAQRIEKGGWRM